MSFIEEVERDICEVFLNDQEFAQRHSLKYNGDEYLDIPVTLIKSEEKISDIGNAQHTHAALTTLCVSEKHLTGAVPEPRKYIEVDDGTALGKPYYVRYKIVSVDNAMGMFILELEALEE